MCCSEKKIRYSTFSCLPLIREMAKSLILPEGEKTINMAKCIFCGQGEDTREAGRRGCEVCIPQYQTAHFPSLMLSSTLPYTKHPMPVHWVFCV